MDKKFLKTAMFKITVAISKVFDDGVINRNACLFAAIQISGKQVTSETLFNGLFLKCFVALTLRSGNISDL